MVASLHQSYADRFSEVFFNQGQNSVHGLGSDGDSDGSYREWWGATA
jgi:hypothetical protein